MIQMDHSYEEIWQVALDILAQKEKIPFSNTQFVEFRNNVAHVLKKRDESASGCSIEHSTFTDSDSSYFQEIFWELFRQGIITLGTEQDPYRAYPFFRLSSFGKRIIENQDAYFFHDVSSYEKVIRENIPEIDNLTLFYLKEAMQTYMVGCRLSASVMLGVALEYSLQNLFDVIEKNPECCKQFSKITEQQFIGGKFKVFRNKLSEIKKELPKETLEELETNFVFIIALIRNYRNESGHPSGKVLSREQCYVNLQLFIPCCKKIYELRAFFKEGL